MEIKYPNGITVTIRPVIRNTINNNIPKPPNLNSEACITCQYYVSNNCKLNKALFMMTTGRCAIFTSVSDPELTEEKEQNIMKGEKTMTVIINYKRYNKDDSYEVKSYIEKYCDGVISHGEKEIIIVNGTNTVSFDHVIQFSIINDN